MLLSDLLQVNGFDTIQCHTIIRLSDIFVITVLIMACGVILPSEQNSYPIPRRPRVFVTHYRDETLTDYSVAVHFRWSSPVSVDNFQLTSYNVLVSNTTSMWLTNESVPDNRLDYELEPAPKNAILYFKVRACSRFICGQYTDLVTTNTAVENPPPKVLIIGPHLATMYLPDTKSLVQFSSESITALTLVTLDDTFYWISAVSGELREETGTSVKSLTTLRNEALNMVVDWIGRYLFWLERSSNQCTYIQRHDLSQSSKEPVTVAFLCDYINGTIHYIQVDPFHSAIYYTRSYSNVSAVSLVKYRYNVQEAEVIMGLVDSSSSSRDCICSKMTVLPVFTADPRPNDVNNISIYVVDATKWDIWGFDKDGCYCSVILNSSLVVESRLGFPPLSLTVDLHRLYWISQQSQNILYSINKYTGKDFLAESIASDLMSFILGYNVSPLPERNCLILQSVNHSISLLNATSTSFTLQFRVSASSLQICGDLSLPSVYYVLEYSELDSNESKVMEHIYEKEVILLAWLKPYTFYNISIGASNYFVSLWKSHSMSPSVLLQTKPGIPSSPQNVTVSVLTASTVSVQWQVPSEPHGNLSEIIYAINWAGSSPPSNGTVWIREPGRGKFLTAAVQGLSDSQIYEFKVLAYDNELTGSSSSLLSSAKTFQNPGPVQLLAATTDSLLLSWISPADNSVTKFTVEYAEVNEQHTGDLFWQKHLVDGQMIHISGPKMQRNVNISGLKSGQAYAARVEVFYQSDQPYTWPTTNFSIFHTQSRRPGSPGIPYITKGTEDMHFTMYWSSPTDQWSLSVDSYQLVCSLPDSESNTSEVYMGYDSFWPVNGLTDSTPYFCRARARNQFGWGSFSNWSAVFVYQLPSPSQDAESVMMMKVILIPLFVLLVVIFIIATVTFVLCKFGRRFCPLSGFVSKVNPLPPNVDEFCLRSSAADENLKKYYALNTMPALEEASCSMPSFCRDGVTFTKFICERKNGDMFEGLAKDIDGGDGQMPVIVMTINSGELSEQDMEEQMKEIAFMNCMRHKNIISMLGVCLVGKPLLLIFESPGVGDFLTFLRSYQSTTQTISVLNLLSFCLDVVSGCQFFEERHLVHRDMRAKHCFVFSQSSSYLIKIGGFSLLKDISENKTCLELPSYEMLPSRWMAPEAITDNFFTSMSDVWAFGVVMWEVFTFGQVPYSDKTNETEIFQYLESGGRLNRPIHCPESVFSVMLSCWRSSPFRRPSFHYLADQLQKLHKHLDDDQADTNHISEEVNSGSTAADSSTEDMSRAEPGS